MLWPVAASFQSLSRPHVAFVPFFSTDTFHWLWGPPALITQADLIMKALITAAQALFYKYGHIHRFWMVLSFGDHHSTHYLGPGWPQGNQRRGHAVIQGAVIVAWPGQGTQSAAGFRGVRRQSSKDLKSDSCGQWGGGRSEG